MLVKTGPQTQWIYATRCQIPLTIWSADPSLTAPVWCPWCPACGSMGADVEVATMAAWSWTWCSWPVMFIMWLLWSMELCMEWSIVSCMEWFWNERRCCAILHICTKCYNSTVECRYDTVQYSSTVRYCINDCRNSGRISIRCWIYKKTPHISP